MKCRHRPDDDPKQVARQLVDQMSFRRPWDIEAFTADVALHTGKAITVAALPASLEAEITGLWVPEKNINRIYVTSQGTDTYQEHVRCHELAHILLQHEGRDEVDLEAYRAQLARVAPDLPIGFLAQLGPARVCFARASYMSELEQTAEWIATLIQTRADAVRDDVYLDGHDKSSYAIADRLLKALGWRS